MKMLRFSLTKIAVAAVCVAVALSNAAPAQSQTATYWPMMLGSPAHNSHVADSKISTSNASTLGVKFMAHIFSADLGSPVVAYNSTLGKAVVYVGNERGDLFAVDANTGQMIWSTNFGVGDSLLDTPAVAPDGTVWVGTQFNAYLYKVNGATGQVLCSVQSPNQHPIMGSPMIVTPAGGTETVYWDAVDNGVNGPLVSSNESTCGTNFDDTVYAGSWSTPSYAVDGAGEALVLTGEADPGCTENAYDAQTGKTVWTVFLAVYNPCTADVGNAGSISPPGTNGFADGVDYVADDDATEYALDLNSGTVLWSYNSYGTNFTGKRYQIATMALDGNQVVYGYYNGLNSLNATTGSVLWADSDATGIDSSPDIIGPSGSEVVAYADIAGLFQVVSLASGSQLYKYQTGGYISASPAEYNGTFYITSADGFLYAFTPGGSNGTKPSESIASLTNGATVANPDGSLTLSGTATDPTSVSAVEIAIQSGGSSGPWYDAATDTWNAAPVRNEATLTSPGAASTNWSFALPVPASGNNYQIFANTVGSSNLVDPGSNVYFAVAPASNEPVLHTSAYDVPPGGTFTATGTKFKPGETATFTFFGSTVATATVGSSGNVPQTSIAVPSDSLFGPTSLTVTGDTSGKSASTQIYVSNAWTQSGYSGLRAAMEPQDYVINHTIFVGASVLGVDWSYPSEAAINTTPAIQDGIAYFGNDAGKLSAITVVSGSPVWTYTIPSGKPIRSSPAIDGAKNLIFGANDGNLYIVNSSGKLVTTVALGGTLDAPAYANGNIVIGSSTGSIYSIADPAWTTNWSVSAGSAPSVPPAYDGPNGLVIVGTSNGSVIGYSSSTGSVKWTATTGGAISGLSIAGSQVFVGSADGNVYAFNERTGAQNFKIPSGDNSAVTALDANGGGPAWGTADGDMYEANAKGSVYYTKQYATTPVIGMAGAGTDEFGAYAAGDLGLLRSADGGFFYSSGSTYSVAPVVLDGILFQGDENGDMVAFTTQGYTVSPQASVRVGSVNVDIDGSTNCMP